MLGKAKINYSYISLILLGLATVILFIALLMKAYPLFLAGSPSVCQWYLSRTLYELPRSLPGLFLLIAGSILSIGIVSVGVQLIRTHRLYRSIRRRQIPLTGSLQTVVHRIGLTHRVILVADDNLYSFCFGFLRPRVIISSGLVSHLSYKELEAVLLHEQAHLKNRDPLKLLVGNAVATMFFFLPVFAELYRNMEASNELIADSWTTAVQKDTLFLRRALRKIIAQAPLTLAAVAGISHPDHIEIRVHQLKNMKIKQKLTLSYRSIVGSLIFLVGGIFILQTPVEAFRTQSPNESIYSVCSTDAACRQGCEAGTVSGGLNDPSRLPAPTNSSPAVSTYKAPSYK